PFVLPPFVLVTAVAVFYAKYQGLNQVHDVFLGVGPAVLAIIAIAAYKLARSTNKSDPILWLIAAILCAATAISGAEIVWLFILKYEEHPRLKGFVKGATAAAVGAIAGAAIVITNQVIHNATSVLIGVIALALLLQKRKKITEPALVAAAAIAGLLAFG